MAATSSGTQQQHKVNVAAVHDAAIFNTATVSRNNHQQQQPQQNIIQQQQHAMTFMQQQQNAQHLNQLQHQQQNLQNIQQSHDQFQYLKQQEKELRHKDQHLINGQQLLSGNQPRHQQYTHPLQQQQQQCQKYVTRVVTNANVTLHHQRQQQPPSQQYQQQTVRAGLVNGNNSATKCVSVRVSQQLQSNEYQANMHQQQLLQQTSQSKLPQQNQGTIANSPPQPNVPTTVAASIAYAKNFITPPSSAISTSAVGMPAKSATIAVANLAPGWRRLNAKNEIVYISPTGETLRTQFQIKDYLLSPGTCKCGLPCPLRPEFFFDLNAQVPNLLLKSSPPETHLAAKNSTSLSCLHQKHFLDSQWLHANSSSPASTFSSSLSFSSSSAESETSSGSNTIKEIKRRKLTTLPSSATTTSVSGIQPQTASQTTYSKQKSQVLPAAIEREQQTIAINMTVPSKPISNACTTSTEHPFSESAETDVTFAHQIGSVTLSKTPPWRKSTSSSTVVDERVPPLPEGHLPQAQTVTSNELSTTSIPPPWQSSTNRKDSPSRFSNGTVSASPAKRSLYVSAKKQPNFKDDPTGYLQQQTELLHNSMMNVAIEADEEDAALVESARQQQQQMVTQVQKLRAETATVMKQTLQNVELQLENVADSNKQPQQQHKNCFQYAGRVYDAHGSAQKYQQSQQTGAMFRIQQKSQEPHQQRKTVQVINQQVIPPSSQAAATTVATAIVGQSSKQTENAETLTTQNNFQPFTTSFGGQTVTQMPNGLVHIEQNCDAPNITAPFKPQQQIQLQQQIQQHNLLYRQNIQQQKQAVGNPVVTLVPTVRESPVSSSTTYARSTPDIQFQSPNGYNKGPAQVGAISTSNESLRLCPLSPAESVDCASSRASSAKTTPSPSLQNQQLKQQFMQSTSQQQFVQMRVQQPSQPQKQLKQTKIVRQQQQQRVAPQQLVAKNTLTTLAGNRAGTTTTVSTAATSPTLGSQQKFQGNLQKTSPNNSDISVSNLQLQSAVRSSNATNTGQIIMTSSGQIIVMPTNGKPNTQQGQQQLIIATGSNPTNATAQQQAPSVILHQQQQHNQVDIINGQHLTTAPSNGIILQTNQQQQSASGFIVSHSPGNTASTSQMQPTTVILNPGQNILTSNGSKVLTASGSNIIHAGNQQLIASNHQLLTSQNTTSMMGQQAVVLNTLPNGGYVIQQPTNQQQFATIDGQVVSQIVQQADGSTAYVQQSPSGQQQTQRIIITSPENSKRKAKKRKNSVGSSPSSTPSTLSPHTSPKIPNQTATIMHAQQPATQQPQVVQIATTTTASPQYQPQFQLSPGIQGIVVNKTSTPQNAIAAQPQQILLQNGQIIQPMNLIGQQLLVPGLVMSPETTLLQIQNVGTCGTSILTTTPPGTMMLRAPSPQNKQFLSPSATGQQFIVGSNGQLSPIGQIYSTPMGLVMPQQNTAATTFVQPQHQQLQHHVALQQTQQMHRQQNIALSCDHLTSESASSSSSSSVCQRAAAAASPPDTTTHSPSSPERPLSNRSGGSEMVQCVSSSEPDGAVSPQSVENPQSPSTTDCERGIVMSTSYQNTNIYKPSRAKTRRVQIPPQYNASVATTTTRAAGAETLMPSHLTTNAMTSSSNHHHHHNQQLQHRASDMMKPDSHESPTNSPTTSSTAITPPPPPPSPAAPLPMQQQQISPQFQKTPTKQSRHRAARGTTKTPSKSPSHNNISTTTDYLSQNLFGNCISSPQQQIQQQTQQLRSFCVGELIWGTARGYPAWPGKIMRMPEGTCSTTQQQSENVWVQWFGAGGRSNTELVAMSSLQSLSEGLDAHHKAQKDTRKSRKLNSQLERAIQEAMIELDRISASSIATTSALAGNNSQQQPTSTSNNTGSPNRNKRGQAARSLVSYSTVPATPKNFNSSAAATSTTIINNLVGQVTSQQRTKPIRIAPAPPGVGNNNSNSPTKTPLNLLSNHQQQSAQAHSIHQTTMSK